MTTITIIASMLLFAGEEINGKVIAIIDGDTLVVVTPDNANVKVRLHGIDAPERKQPFGTFAREKLAELCHDRQVTVAHRGKRSHDRLVGVVFVDGRDVGLAMLSAGLAWHSVKYDRSPAYAAAEIDAHEARRGLWVDDKPVEPWVFRKGKR